MRISVREGNNEKIGIRDKAAKLILNELVGPGLLLIF